MILHGYMEKTLNSNSKKTVQDYQCELNFGELGIDIIGSTHLFRVYSARNSSGTNDTLNFKVLIDCRTTKTRFLCYDPDLRLIVILILPLFEYAEIVWGSQGNESFMSDLQALQNKAARIILDSSYRSSASAAVERLSRVNLKIRRKMHSLIFIYICRNNFFSYRFDLRLHRDYYGYNSRSQFNIRQTAAKRK